MGDAHKAEKVSEHAWWVGAVDWSIRDFHGYDTGRGSTYNAYLIQADDIILVDTVKAPFRDELMARIASVDRRPEEDTLHHLEPRGGRPLGEPGGRCEDGRAGKGLCIEDRRRGSQGAVRHRGAARGRSRDGQKMKLGGVTLEFMETRMLHWPDSMFTYLADDRLLFSQDAFSMHLATGERWQDQIDERASRLRGEAVLRQHPHAL